MSYIADSYVPIKGEMYMPGEKIPDDLPESTINWLLKAKAIHRVAFAGTKDNLPATQPVNVQPEDVQAEEDAGPEADLEDAPEDEKAEDEPVPEIDVMAGIVQDSKKAPEKKPARRAAVSEKKRATKGGKTKCG